MAALSYESPQRILAYNVQSWTICLHDIYTMSTRYLHYIYTMSTYIHICLHDVYSISTRCLHIYVNMMSTQYLHYVYTYDLHDIYTMWQCIIELYTCSHNWLKCVSAAVPWRAARLNIVCVCHSDTPWWTVCHYFVFCIFTVLVWQIDFFLARCLFL